MPKIIEVKNLYFKYDFSYVLENINFSIDKGDFIALIGPNGGGKTTIIKLILGLLKPTKGTALIYGENPLLFKDKSKLGYMPQSTADFNFNFPSTVEEIVSLGLLSTKKFPRKYSKYDKEKIYKAMETAEVLNLKDKLIGSVSGGQLQRVYLAKMLVSEPEILFLDEPTSALDSKTRQNFFNLIIKLNKEKNTTIIFITHDSSRIGAYADKLMVVDNKLLFYGNSEEFCKSDNVQKYFGSFAQHLICQRHNKTPEKLWK